MPARLSGGAAATALRGALALGALMAVAGLGLAWLDAGTSARIEDHRSAARQAVLKELTGLEVELASHRDTVVCDAGLVVLAMTERGYGGAMDVVVAFRDGRLVGVRVPRHSETPGFADILAPSDWIGTLGHGQAAGAQFDAVTGATITADAVLRARAAARARHAERAPWCPR